jgi:hypothetical protein
MAQIAFTIVLVGILVMADVAWAEIRDLLARRLAARRATTLTRRFALPPR